LSFVGLVQETKMFQKTWKFDLSAGFTVAIVALPLALGFGITSGAGAASGLITAIVAGFIAAILGGSNYQVSGPTGAMTVILVPIIATYGTSSLLVLGLMAGAMIVIMGALRLGKLIERVPWSVMEGFTLGIALVIALQQLPLVFAIPKGEGSEALVIAWNTVVDAAANPINWSSIALVLLTLVLMGGWGQLRKRFGSAKNIPGSALAILVVTILVAGLGLDVSTVGSLPADELLRFELAMPSVPIAVLLLPALSIALLGAIESLLAARVADSMAHRRDHESPQTLKPNKELVGQGFATIGSALFGGMPATGAIARTGVNVEAGARTRYSSALHALFLLVMVLFLAPLVSQIPMASLAAVLLATSWRIANPESIKEAMQTIWVERLSYLATAVAVLAIDLIWGLAIGVAVHLIANKVSKLRSLRKSEKA
jgi:SulP family sulfate permease